MKSVQTELTPAQRLNAVCWAAGCAGQSYGKFSQNLSEEQVQQVYLDYQQVLNARRLALENRRRLAAARSRRP